MFFFLLKFCTWLEPGLKKSAQRFLQDSYSFHGKVKMGATACTWRNHDDVVFPFPCIIIHLYTRITLKPLCITLGICGKLLQNSNLHIQHFYSKCKKCYLECWSHCCFGVVCQFWDRCIGYILNPENYLLIVI